VQNEEWNHLRLQLVVLIHAHCLDVAVSDTLIAIVSCISGHGFAARL